MKLKSCLIAALSALAAAPALAADLGYRDGTPYDDPRYSDVYRHPAPPPPRYAAPYPSGPVYRDDRYVTPPYVPAPPPPQRHEGRFSGNCVPREAIRSRLESRGWQDFHDPQPIGNVVHIRARRPNGRLFDITLDRCSGEVLGVEAIDHRAAQAPPPPAPPPQDWRYRERPYDGYRY